MPWWKRTRAGIENCAGKEGEKKKGRTAASQMLMIPTLVCLRLDLTGLASGRCMRMSASIWGIDCTYRVLWHESQRETWHSIELGRDGGEATDRLD